MTRAGDGDDVEVAARYERFQGVADLNPRIRDARANAATGDSESGGRDLPVVVSLVGTDADPQNRRAAQDSLVAAGASVFLSNAQATRHALAHLRSQS